MAGTADTLKMVAKGRLVTRSVTSTRPLEMTLNLDCTDEPLSESQLALRTKLKENYDRVMSSLDEMIKEHGAQIVTQSGTVNALQYKLPTSSTQTLVKANQLTMNQGKSQPIKLNVINNSTPTQGNIQLVMDPRMGVLLSTLPQQQSIPTTTLATVPQKSVITTSNENSQLTRNIRTRTKVVQVQDIVEEPTPTSATTIRVRTKTSGGIVNVSPSPMSNQVISNVKTKLPQKPTASVKSVPSKSTPAVMNLIESPAEHTSIGGIVVNAKNSNSGDTIDDSKKNLPDGRELVLNKPNGSRTFPSLVVIARPHLRAKDVPPQLASKERTELDMRVKSVLMYQAGRFAEWLIQQGLVKSEQYCDQHHSLANRSKLKLAMYSEPGTFPYSGGYVWISNCCRDRFVSVFCGSIFHGAIHTPAVLLKLIYHWACQTNVQNVVNWVKVSNVYVKNFYTNLRSICTSAVWDKSVMMGGKGCSIQVGVISLGTSSPDGNMRQVKVEVLGILNHDTGHIRLRACDPIYDANRSFKCRFNNILHPLKDWVHKDSKILTDFTVDKTTLQEMGFHHVFQSSFSDQNPRNSRSNYQIMEYLRKIVPRMFQNTLSLLSRQMIQQFLDELVWREMFGSTASRAFNNIITHIAEQTRLRSRESLLDRLTRIATNPFADWSYSKDIHIIDYQASRNTLSPPREPTSSQQNNEVPLLTLKTKDTLQTKPGPRRKRKRQATSRTGSLEPPEAKRSNDDSKTKDSDKNDRVSLNEFYYGTLEGNPMTVAKENRRSLSFPCFLCNYTMKSNTDVMQHMISHVPPRVPGQSSSYVCRYCCAAFSTQHQMRTHVEETHSTFGKSDGFMVVCGICEQKFGNSYLLITHMSCTHLPSEMPYRCESCNYRSSSHKDVIDHYYNVHEKGEALQCPYCLKVMQYNVDGHASASNVHAYLVHMQRHTVRREQGRGNKCPRCCLWFNQKSALKKHQEDQHQSCQGVGVQPYISSDKGIMITKSQHQLRRILIRSPSPEIWSSDDKFKKWNCGPLKVNSQNNHLRCQECEEDIDEDQHYPGEQKCTQCRYVTCCWRAFKEHQQQIHNERPMTGLVVPSPLASIPLEKKMKCLCGFATNDGNLLATHLVKCKKVSARPKDDKGMLDSLGLVPKNA